MNANNHQQSSAVIEALFADAIAKVKAEAAQAIARVKAEAAQAIARQKAKSEAQAQQAIAKIRLDSETAMAEEKAKAKKASWQIDRIKAEAELKEKDHDEEITRIKTEKEETISEIRVEHDEQISKVKAEAEENAKALAEQVAGLKTELAEKEKSYAEQIINIKTETEESIASIEAECEQQLAKAKTEAEETITQIKTQAEEKQKSHEEQIDKIRTEADEAITRQKTESESQVRDKERDYDQRVSQIKAESDKKVKDLTEQIARFEAESAEKQKTHSEAIADVNAEKEETIAKIKAEYEEQISRLEAEEKTRVLNSELPASYVHERPPEQKVSPDKADFHEFMVDSASSGQPAGISPSTPVSNRHRPFSTAQKAIVVGIVVTAALLLYALLLTSPPSGVVADVTPALPALRNSVKDGSLSNEPTSAIQQVPHPETPVSDSTQTVQKQIRKPEPEPVPTQPLSLSLKAAQNFCLKGDYGKAYTTYNQLCQSLPNNPKEQLLRDFLQLKMALCVKKAGDFDAAEGLFGQVSESRSPFVMAVANYHLSLLEMRQRQYLKARTRAYQAIALIDAIDPRLRGDDVIPAEAGITSARDPAFLEPKAWHSDWASSLRRHCHFIVAESITRNVLLLCDADKDLPPDLWSGSGALQEPSWQLSESQLLSILNSGLEQLSRALLGPQIQETTGGGAPGSSCWSVICSGASIEELLDGFADNARLDIHWAFQRTEDSSGTGGNASSGVEIHNTQYNICKRPVSLCLSAATTQDVVSTAAGCVGLLAHPDNDGLVNVFNPANYSLLSEHIALLNEEAISLWRRFLITFHDDELIGNAHFALALLYGQNGLVTESLAKYKLVADRYPQTSLAPFALLHSIKLKTTQHDYSGARQDLRQLVEQYTDAEISSRACLYLADATSKAGLNDEAAQLYRKAYNFALSLKAQIRLK